MAAKKHKRRQHDESNEVIATAKGTPHVHSPTDTLSLVFNKSIWYTIIGILVITFAVFSPSLSNDFVFWDDPEYVLNNEHIQEIDLDYLFHDYYMGNYHPLTMLSLCIDYKLYAFQPWGYHLNAILLHLMNTFLVFVLMFYLLGRSRLYVAIVTALLFGIHPMHVESVTWVSERKDVLYTFFYLASLVSYVRYANEQNKKYLISAFVLFVLSCLSKGQAVTLPVIMLGIDWYRNKSYKDIAVVEKIPFFAISMIFGLIALDAQAEEAAINKNFHEGFDSICFGSFGFLVYLYKLLLPINMSGAHPYPWNPEEGMPKIFFIMPFVGLALLGLVAWTISKGKEVIFGFFFYAASISIVLKFIPVGDALYAERYTYIPYIGIFFVIGHYFDQFMKNEQWRSKAKMVGIGIAAIFGFLTVQRTMVWHDTKSFWQDVSETYPDYWRAYNCIGQEEANAGNIEAALKSYSKAIEMDKWAPPIPYLLRGGLYTDQIKDYPKAEADFLAVINFPNKSDLTQIQARHNLGLVYYRMKQYDKALVILNEAQAMDPNSARCFYFKALSLTALNRLDDAIANYNRALQLDPNYISALLNRGVLYTDKTNQYDLGIKDFTKVMQMIPNHKDANINIGICWFKKNEFQKALKAYSKALSMYPNEPRVYYLSALVHAKTGDYKSAIQAAEKAAQMGMQIPIETLNDWKQHL